MNITSGHFYIATKLFFSSKMSSILTPEFVEYPKSFYLYNPFLGSNVILLLVNQFCKFKKIG